MIPRRIARELLYHLEQADALERLVRALTHPSIFRRLDNGADRDEMLAAWHRLRSRGIDPSASVREASRSWQPTLGSVEHGRTLLVAAELLERLAEWRTSEELGVRSLETATEGGDMAGIAEAEYLLGRNLLKLSELDRSLAALDRARELFEQMGDMHNVTLLLQTMASAYNRSGNSELALECYQRQLANAKALDDRLLVAQAMGNLGTIYLERGDVEGALESFRHQLSVCQQLGNREGTIHALHNIGVAYGYRYELEQALDNFETVFAMCEEIGARDLIAITLGSLADLHVKTGEFDRARDYFQRQAALCKEMDDRRGTALAIGNLGTVYYKSGDLDHALECYTRQLATVTEVGDRREMAVVLGNLGNIHADRGDNERALDCYRQQLDLGREIELPRVVMSALGNSSDVHFDQTNYEEAWRCLQSAIDMSRALDLRTELPMWLLRSADLLLAVATTETERPSYLSSHLPDDQTWNTAALRLARTYLTESMEIALETGNHESELDWTIASAELHVAEGSLSEALKTLDASLERSTDDFQRAILHGWRWKLAPHSSSLNRNAALELLPRFANRMSPSELETWLKELETTTYIDEQP